ncbi:MAG: hypothetical protein Q9210_003597 [Variospora velana]
MTTYATRSPLQLIHNPHMMSQPRRSSRRLSARLGDQEDAPATNGLPLVNEKSKSGQSSGPHAKQTRGGVNGATSNAPGTKAKRKLDNDEDSDGFKFTRTHAKKAKAEPAVQIPLIEEDKHEESPPKPVPIKRTRKRISLSSSAAAAEAPEKPERRRKSPRNSGDKDLIANEQPLAPLEVKKKRKPKDDRPQETRKSKKQDQATSTQPQGTAAPEPPRTQPVDKPLDPIKVSLPFADTPIIRRNKEMRKGAENGSRRSSLGMRGRRASSLIDSGKSDGKEVPVPYICNMTDDILALPHDEVDSFEFYKHIESSLTEPRRMKQLLTWCGTRALGEKPSSSQPDFQARQAAREIQQQLLKDFSTKSEMSDWFNRKDTTPPPQPPKPNPKNVSNENKIRDLEQQLARYDPEDLSSSDLKLQTERQTWETLLRPPSESLSLSLLTANPAPESISSDLLASPSQISALEILQSVPSTNPDPSSSSSSKPNNITSQDLQTSTSYRLQQITYNIEFSIDRFATNVHALNAFKNSADRVAGEVLAISAEALEEREQAGRRRGDGESECEGKEFDAIGNQSSDESGNQTSTATVTGGTSTEIVTGTITTDETESTGSGGREASTSTTPPNTVDISSPTATSSAAAPTIPPPEPVDKGLSTASKAGIGVGVVLGTAIICGICFLLFKRRRRQRQQQRQDPEPEKEGKALEPPPAYPYEKTAQELDAQGVAGPTLSTPRHSRSQGTEHELEGNPDRNGQEIDSNPLHEAPINVPEAPIVELGTNTTTGGGGPPVPPAPLGRERSHKSDTDDLSKLEQEERQLQEEIARLEKLERLKSERDEVREKIKDLHQQQQLGRASRSLSTPVD